MRYAVVRGMEIHGWVMRTVTTGTRLRTEKEGRVRLDQLSAQFMDVVDLKWRNVSTGRRTFCSPSWSLFLWRDVAFVQAIQRRFSYESMDTLARWGVPGAWGSAPYYTICLWHSDDWIHFLGY